MPSGPQQLVFQIGDSLCTDTEVVILLVVGFPRRCLRGLDLLLLTCCLLAAGSLVY